MMRLSNTYNIIAILLVAMLFSAFQTTFWFQMFGEFPQPLLWLNLITYLALYREFYSGVLTIYACALVMSVFTVSPIGVIALHFFIIYCLLWILKNRVFWPGSRYYIIATTVAVIAFHVTTIFISKSVLNLPIVFDLFNRIGQTLMTPLFALPVYVLMRSIDRWTIPDIGQTDSPTVGSDL